MRIRVVFFSHLERKILQGKMLSNSFPLLIKQFSSSPSFPLPHFKSTHLNQIRLNVVGPSYLQFWVIGMNRWLMIICLVFSSSSPFYVSASQWGKNQVGQTICIGLLIVLIRSTHQGLREFHFTIMPPMGSTSATIRII